MNNCWVERMDDIESVFSCPNCGHAVETTEVAIYETSPEPLPNQVVMEDWEVDTEYSVFSLRKCPKCNQPFLHKYSFLIHHEAGTYLQETEQLCPSSDSQLLSIGSVPKRISGIYRQAKACFDNGLNEASVIMCRKCLEAICHDLDAKGKALSDRIQNIHQQEKIDKKLLEWANQLRLIGNDAAHDIEITIRKKDAKDSITFLNALLLYIYTLEKKFATLKARRERN